MLIPSLLFGRGKSSDAAVVCADKNATFSYAELARIVTNLAGTLQLQGLRPRDCLAILLPNSIEFAAAFFGALTADAVVMPLDMHLKRADLLTVIGITTPRILVTTPALYRKIESDVRHTIICLLEFDRRLAVRFVNPSGATTSNEGPLVNDASPRRVGLARTISPAKDAVLILSSGSTGLPKVVRLSHQAILQNIRMHLESLEIEEGIRGLQLLPMNYSYGLIASFLSILRTGGTAVLLSTPEPKSVQTTVAEYEPNLMMGTPALYQYLIERAPTSSAFAESPLRYVTVGGDRCRRYALDLIRHTLPSARVYLTYGLTEAGPRVSTLPHHLVNKFPQSVGFPLREVEIFIRDESGRERPAGEIGEIIVKTPSLMTGYFGDLQRTQQVIGDGLCHTGDIGYLDRRGLLYCIGRKDRQFKLGGRMVNPSVIEQCISSHPLVREVAVEKIENERDELICAKIKAGNARQKDLLPELRRLCRRHLPSHLVPREFRFDDHDHYYYKGRILDPTAEPVPEEPALQTY
jgi:acyl-CoA synthetase (AMP-forming)/AMP-acid ligase II